MYLSLVTYPGAHTFPGKTPIREPLPQPGGGPGGPLPHPAWVVQEDYEAPIVDGRVVPSTRAQQVLLQSGAMAARAFMVSADGSSRTPLPMIAGGQVTADGKSLVRRTGSISVLGAWEESLRSVLTPYGPRVQVQRGVRVATNAIEWMTLMLGPIWEVDQADDEAGMGPMKLAIKDEMAMVSRVKFDFATMTDTNELVVDAIRRFIRGALPLATVVDLTGSEEKCGKMDLQTDRAAAVDKLATSIGADCYAGREFQTFYIVPTPSFLDPIRWSLITGAESNVATITRKRSADKAYNRVVAIGESPSKTGTTKGPPPYAVAEIESQLDPLHPAGPFGRSTYTYSSAGLASHTMCERAAAKVLARVAGADTEMAFTSLVNPAADPGDVFESRVTDGVRRLHIADSITYPLGAAESQAIPCRTRDLSNLDIGVVQ